MARAGYKKTKKQDRNKLQLKGSKKTHLPKGQNVTDTNFRVKKVVIRDQVHEHKEGEILNSKNLSIQQLISRLTHHNMMMKHDALIGLKELLSPLTNEIKQFHLAAIIKAASKLIIDESSTIRKDIYKLFMTILSQTSVLEIKHHFLLLSSHLICGLTSINSPTQEDSLFLLDIFLKYKPELCANCVGDLLPILIDLVSSENTGTRTLKLNLESKFTSGKWRVNVFARISSLLLAYQSKEKKTKFPTVSTKINRISANSYTKPIYFSLFDTNLNYNFEEQRINIGSYHRLSATSEKFDLKEFSEAIIPLLFEAFIELVPLEKNMIDTTGTKNISSEVAMLLYSITNIIHVLWDLVSSSGKSFENQQWMQNKFGKYFFKCFIENRFPYSVETSAVNKNKKKKNVTNIIECNELPSNYMQNILLAKLLINLNKSTHWDPAIDYLKGCIRISSKFSVDECSLLIACFSKICTSRSDDAKHFLGALKTLSYSKNSFLSSLAISALYNIIVDSNLSHLHEDDNLLIWLDSLPERLTKPSISPKILDIICDIARRHLPAFSRSLDGSIELILDNLPSLTIDGLPDEDDGFHDNDGRLKVAQLLYWVKDWDSEMEETLHKGLKNNYWGTSISNQIRDILKMKGKYNPSETETVEMLE